MNLMLYLRARLYHTVNIFSSPQQAHAQADCNLQPDEEQKHTRPHIILTGVAWAATIEV